MKNNLIYTSYFANLRYIPKDFVPVSISLCPPTWYKGLEYKQLAPTHYILSDFKMNCDVDLYTERFKKYILDLLCPSLLVNDLKSLIRYDGHHKIVLICYERPGEFCHRHLVADWLNENGYTCVELQKGIHW